MQKLIFDFTIIIISNDFGVFQKDNIVSLCNIFLLMRKLNMRYWDLAPSDLL